MTAHRDFNKLAEILASEEPEEAISDLASWLGKIPDDERNAPEQAAYLLTYMSWPIVTNGFHDLFFQAWSLADYRQAISHLEELGCIREKTLLEEAFQIYTRGNLNVSQEEFSNLDPFGEGAEWERFDKIADEFDLGTQAALAAFKHFKAISPRLYQREFE